MKLFLKLLLLITFVFSLILNCFVYYMTVTPRAEMQAYFQEFCEPTGLGFECKLIK